MFRLFRFGINNYMISIGKSRNENLSERRRVLHTSDWASTGLRRSLVQRSKRNKTLGGTHTAVDASSLELALSS